MGNIIEAEELTKKFDHRFDVAREMADDMGVNFQSLIEQGMVPRSAAIGQYHLTAIFRGESENRTLLFPMEDVTLEPDPGLQTPQSIADKFGISPNENREEIIYATCDLIFENLEKRSQRLTSQQPGILELTEEEKELLSHTFTEKLISRALSIVDPKNSVKMYIGKLSGRRIMEVRSHGEGRWYRVSSDWCQCPSYYYKSNYNFEQGRVHCCKHQLALRFALASGLCTRQYIDDAAMDQMFQ
eukprot:CAMPEP_0114496818 /NCGR_PEP_ID=MMETSP0109-20121206/5976_1 /TAXON_ID=29199 /ORGANISM="Chlorarachnion reptans, Strain CCCM449" /LENGTH=242 /DNA_ID=CAMNT_0001674123 /DNA_START=364 /DNA_END=1093 /DNA_ORIENTATION=+